MLWWLLACGGGVTTSSEPPAPPVAAPSPPPEPGAELAEAPEGRWAATHVFVSKERGRAEAIELARAIRGRALSGGDLEVLAAEYSEAPTARRRGRVGIYSTGTLHPRFEAAVASVEVGEVAPLIETETGFHVIRRDPVSVYRMRHILVTHAGAWRATTDRSVAEARARRDEAEAALAAGEPFAEVAEKWSDAEEGWQGTVAGPGQLLPALETAVRSLRPGTRAQVSTPYGLHIVERLPDDETPGARDTDTP